MLRIGLVGCGRIAKRHSELLGNGQIEGAELVSVCDLVATKAETIAALFGVPWFTDMHEMMEQTELDVVVILTESGLHAEHVIALAPYGKHIIVEKPMALTLDDADEMIRACDQHGVRLFVVKQNRFNVPILKLREALEAGIHTYIEKPIALNLDQADDLIRLAEAKGLLSQVGHQERFVFAAFGLLSRNRTPNRIECHRAGPFTGRAMDVSVVLDLMIHDLDLVHQVSPAPVANLAVSAKCLHGEHEDEVDAVLTLTDGCEIRLFASRMAEARNRFMKLEYDDGTVEIDFINRTLKNTTGAELKSAFDIHKEGLPAIADDPLGHAIGAFVTAVRLGGEPIVTGPDARRALATALQIIEACHAKQT